MNYEFSPSKNHGCWLTVDYATLLQNIQQHAIRAPLIDLSIPFLIAIWSHLEDDLLRAGIAGVLSRDPRALTAVSPSLQRILKPGFRYGEAGYAREGIVPVLSSFADCLNLSNMAQMLDQRLSFLLRVHTCASEFSGGDWGIESICQRLGNLPMIDLAGLFLQRGPDREETSFLRRLLQQAGHPNGQLLLPLACADLSVREIRPFSLWEAVALDKNSSGCLPFSAGFWAFPVNSGDDHQIFKADIGHLHGLGDEFPVQIAGMPTRVVRVDHDCSEFMVTGHCQGPFPARGYLTGGSTHDPIDLRHWNRVDLQNLLGNLRNYPVYLRKDKKIIEILP